MGAELGPGSLQKRQLALNPEWQHNMGLGLKQMTPEQSQLFEERSRARAAELRSVLAPALEDPAKRQHAEGLLHYMLERQQHEFAAAWSSAGDVRNAPLTRPGIGGETGHVGQPKCNLFIFEMLHSTGTYATPKQIPNANELASQAKAISAGVSPLGFGQVQWFDVVKPEEARFGDIIVINSKDRWDSKKEQPIKHGHVEFIQEVVKNNAGQISDIVTIGASSSVGIKPRGMNKKTNPEKYVRRTFGAYNETTDIFSVNPATQIIRPRLLR